MSSLKILLLEDVPEEAEMVQRELHKADLTFVAQCVQTRTAFIQALEQFAPDLILADSRLPAFDGRSALRIARERRPDVPVIMVTGALGDEAAVELLIEGASDYVLKDRLARLAPAVRRALDEAAMKRARRAADERVKRLTRVLQMLSGINSAVVRMHDMQGLFEEACRLAHSVGNYAFAFVAMIDSNTRRARPVAWAGTGEDELNETSFQVAETAHDDDSITGRVLRTGETLVCDDLRTFTGKAAPREVIPSPSGQAIVSLPLLIDGTPVGAFTVSAVEHLAIGQDELELLLEVVANLSFAMQYLQRENTVRYLSYFDPLTGLAKRSLFCERLTRILSRPVTQALDPAVVAFKIGCLSVVNGSFGRHTGDLLLQCVADRLKQRFGDSEHVAHLNGGVFAVLVLQTATPAPTAHEQVFQLFGEPLLVRGRDIPVPVRCGLARYPIDGTEPEELVNNAEAALHFARDTGASYMYHRADMSSGSAERLELEQRLRGALDRNEFVVLYQPQVQHSTHRIVGAEALLRWNDPERGLVAPDTFLQTLESTGLIVRVGEWVVRQVARDCQRWRDLGLSPMRIAVNVSTVELSNTDFAERFLEISGLRNGGRCEMDVEITEGVLLDDPEFVSQRLQQLRAYGVRVAIDDFGTGHSSLSRLARLPIDVLKVDRSFISNLTRERTSQAVVSTIIALARTYELGTIAEGVETPEQSEILAALGCEESQGYLYSAPVPAATLESMLRQNGSHPLT